MGCVQAGQPPPSPAGAFCTAWDPTVYNWLLLRRAVFIQLVPSIAGTINGALDVAPEGSIILVSSGVFEERVVVRTPNITLRSIELDKAVIAWGTPNPYEAALQCEAPGLTVEGFAIKCAVGGACHHEPSVSFSGG